jgi:4-hydroxybenzoate polyprenyltransferase
MKTATKYLALNIGMIVGFFIALFLIPGRTPFWLVATIAAAYVAYMNYSLHRRLARGGLPQSRSYEWSVTIIVILLLIFDLILGK